MGCCTMSSKAKLWFLPLQTGRELSKMGYFIMSNKIKLWFFTLTNLYKIIICNGLFYHEQYSIVVVRYPQNGPMSEMP